MTAHDEPRTRGGRARTVVLAFLAGLLIALLAASALLLLGVVELQGTEAAAEEPAAGAGPTSGDVPEPCLRSAEHSATVSAALDEVGVGVRDQDARTVQEALDAINDVRAEMDAASEECRALAGQPAREGGTEDDDADGAAGEGVTDAPTGEPTDRATAGPTGGLGDPSTPDPVSPDSEPTGGATAAPGR